MILLKMVDAHSKKSGCTTLKNGGCVILGIEITEIITKIWINYWSNNNNFVNNSFVNEKIVHF